MTQINDRKKCESDKNSENDEFLQYEDLSLNKRTHEVWLCGESIALTPTEFGILRILMLEEGKPISTEDIFHALWPAEYYTKNNSISVHIRHLREKMKDDVKKPKYIKTEWRVGYRLIN